MQGVVLGSKYVFNKVFQNNIDKVKFYFYCKACKANLGSQNDVLENSVTKCLLFRVFRV